MKEQLNLKKRLTLGADPEMFIRAGVKLIPAFEFLPPKESGSLMYWDGFQAEWKYNFEGNHCSNNLVKYTRESLMELNRRAKMFNPKAKLALESVVRVPQITLQKAHPMHVALGCEPSFNIYKLKGTPVEDTRKLLYRFAGGHMHFGGWTQKPKYEAIVKTLDMILGVWSVGATQHMDDPIRRQYYGLPGEFRTPVYPDGSYGVEYRVLSNFWLESPAVMQLTWDIGKLCVRLAGTRHVKLWAGNEQATIETIRNCDYEQARKILKRNEPMFRWLLSHCYMKKESATDALQLAYAGLGSDGNIPQNWHFGAEWIPDAKAPWARWEQS